MGPNDILTLSEAARLVRVSRKTMGELARSGQVPGQKVGREWRFLKSSLVAWLAGQYSPEGITDTRHPETNRSEPRVQSSGFSDTAFTENRNRRLHRWGTLDCGIFKYVCNPSTKSSGPGREGTTGT